jgi:glycerol-3-phosphate acyltransferase PlsY
VRFAGGKGVATTAGAFFALAPHAVAMCLLLWIVCLVLFRIVSVASLVGAIALPPAILAADRIFGGDTHPSVLVLAILTAVLVIYKHRSNIGRLIRGEEGRIFGSEKNDGSERDRVI